MEMITIKKSELINLENRVKKLASEKSYLQLMANLMNRLSSVSGLENTIENMLGIVMENIGGSNISIYYRIDDVYHYTDVFNKKLKLDAIDDINVSRVFETHENIEFVHDFTTSKMTTPGVSNAYTWIFPLLVGHEIIGVFKIEDIILSKREVHHHLQIFFNYAAHILKNEILGYTRLQAAHEQLRLSHEKLRLSEERYRTTLDSMLEGCAILGYDYSFLYVNDTNARHAHRKKEEMLGKTLFELFPGVEDSPFFKIYKECMEERRPTQTESAFTFPDGSTSWIEAHAEPVSEGIFVLTMDITERKVTELALQKSEAELRELNTTKDKFFSIIAHDLKSPFSSIFGFTDLLIHDVGKLNSSEIAGFLTRIANSSKQAYMLLENLLIWASTQTGKIGFQPEPINIQERIHDIVELFENQVIQKNIHLSLAVNDNLTVAADKNMIDTVIRNLLTNAIKFTPRGGRITVSATKQNDQVEITISDNGVGIAKDNLANIFKIESKTSTLGTEKEKGTGLGLILCREFVEKHGGNIRAESEPGKGSTFSFTIPGVRR